ncbi:phosphoenolpyruvate--protein phosphotransferase [Agarivorans albus]
MSFFKSLFASSEKETEVASQPELVQSATIEQPVAAKEEPDSLQVETKQIFLNQNFNSKEQVLRFVSEQMLALGLVNADYFDALQARENKVSTYLINGVAIPHGVNEAKPLVAQSGVVIVQIPEGISWNDNGDSVKLVVGIAAKGEDHLSLLQTLTTVVMDETLSAQLASTEDKFDIINALGAGASAEAVVEDDFAISQSALIVDEAGMHARPASLLSEQAASFANTQIRIRNGEQSANAKSMAALLAMGAKLGDSVVVSAEGEQAEQAVQLLSDMIKAGLDSEEDNANAEFNPLAGLPALVNATGDAVLQGMAASPGIAAAPIFVLRASNISVEQQGSGESNEKQALQEALSKAAEQSDELHNKLLEKAPQEAAILKAQKQLLSDEAINQECLQYIEQGNSAAWSWQQALTSQIDALSKVEDERLKARIADLNDVSQRVIAILTSAETLSFPDEEFILLAKDLSPSQTAGLEGKAVKAIATELGGPNSHMAILARGLGIPAVVGVGAGKLCEVADQQMAVVDPQSASVVINPSSETLEQASQNIDTWLQMRLAEAEHQHEPAVTKDGRHIEVVCNIAKPKDAPSILENGGEGAGLLRTEFLFEASSEEPSIEQQIDALKSIAKELGDRQLVVRTADIGGDKPVSWMDMPHEDNPFLGVRGVRLSFKHQDMFERQLEAIYRTAIWQVEQFGKSGIHIMFPMIAKMSEWTKAKELADKIRVSLNAPELPLGIMVEVPSAALVADTLAKHVDFFSIGSNDLTQYTLAMDRLNPELCCEADSYHPGLLRLISMTVKAATANGKWVGVCGNMAADPNIACLLVGMGVQELSVSPANVPAVKNIIRSVSYSKLQAKAEKALQMCSSEAVMAMYKNHDDLI